MTCLPPLSRAALLVLALLTVGCAAQSPRPDAPPETAIVEPAAEAPAMPAPADTAADAAGNAEAGAMPIAASAEGDTATEASTPDTVADAGNAADQPTDAERDYAAIYGTAAPETYNPIADPTLPPPAEMPTSFDPWERYNRQVHRFNMVVDRRIAKPLAHAYVHAVPRPVRLGVSNFFNNLGQPVSALNALLQGKPKQAGQAVGRFLLNSTLGIGGLFDPATSANLPNRGEDFGQTLGVWGWKKSRYVELPLFGPRTVRDVFGMAGDAPLSPTRRIEEDKIRIFLQGLQLVDVRAQLLSTDSLREGAADDYALVRDAWLQRRNYQIRGDEASDDDDTLPEYLREGDDAPTVPASAMPLPNPP